MNTLYNSMWIFIYYIISMRILKLYKINTKRGVGRIAPCCHLPFSRFLFMQKDDKKKLISPKNF